MKQTLWTKQGESLSHNNACKEYALEEQEIIDAIKLGKLQYIVNYAHGNPYYKLLRQEVIALAIELRGDGYFKKQEIEIKIKKLKSEVNSYERKIKINKKEIDSLKEQLYQLENKND